MANLSTSITPERTSYGKIVPEHVLADRRRVRNERIKLAGRTILAQAIEQEAASS
jgi:hypothetical protein